MRDVKMSEILMDEDFNCRGQIAPIDVVDLAKDIEAQGLIQPVIISPLAMPINGRPFKLIAGHRRFKAHIILKRETILAVVRDEPMSEIDARTINLAENLKRKDLNVLQEAKAIRHFFILGLGELQIANKLGQSRGWVQIRAMLLKLPEEIQREVEAGLVSHSNIRELYAIHKAGNKDNLYKAVREIKDKKLRGLTKICVNKNIVGPHAENKRYRIKTEIEKMTILLVEHRLKGLATRALAWAAGNLTMADFADDIAAYAAENVVDYVPITDKELEAVCER
jgi:ParB/RepB/Spo0J family partition protein